MVKFFFYLYKKFRLFTDFLIGLNEGENIVAEGLKKVRHRGKIKPIKK